MTILTYKITGTSLKYNAMHQFDLNEVPIFNVERLHKVQMCMNQAPQSQLKIIQRSRGTIISSSEGYFW